MSWKRSSRSSLWTPSRRDFLRIGGIGAVGLVAAACGGPSVGGENVGPAAATGTDWSKITPASEITWWSNHPGKSKEMEESFIAAFNREHPDIRVNLVTAGANYDEVAQRYQAAAGTKDLPDLVIASDVYWFRYFVNGQVMPLDDIFRFLDADTGDFVSTLYDDYSYQGSHWAAPYARSTPLFYYNKAHWAAAGLPDRGPATWDELAEWAPALRKVVPAEGAPLGLSLGPSWSAWWFSNILWGRGGAYSNEWEVTLSTPEAIEAGNFVRDMYKGPNAFASVASDNYTSDFAAGLYGAILGSTGSLSGLLSSASFELGAAYLPDGPVPGRNVPTGGTGLAITASRTPEQQLAAAMFLKFLTNSENTAKFSAGTGYMPVRTSAIDGATMNAIYKEKPQYRVSVNQLQEKTRSQDYVRVFVPGGDQILTDGIERFALEGASAEAVWPPVTTRLQTAFKENVEPYL